MRLARYWIPSAFIATQLIVGCVDVLPATPDPTDRDQNGATDDGGASNGGLTGGTTGDVTGGETGDVTGGGGMDGGMSTPGNGNGGMDGGGVIPDASAPAEDAGAGDAALPSALDCESYCETIQAACTGENSQYDSLQECLAMCEDMPSGKLNDASGDSMGCRLYHAQNAMKQAAPAVHCPHAGPSGGGVCGSRCEALCDRATKLCTDDRGYPEAYSSREDCLIICEPNPGTGLGGYRVDSSKELPASGNTVNCRIYHLRNAYTRLNENDQENDSAGVHCNHVGRVSPTCL